MRPKVWRVPGRANDAVPERAAARAGALPESLGRRDSALVHYRKAIRLLGGGTGRCAEMARQAQAGIDRIAG